MGYGLEERVDFVVQRINAVVGDASVGDRGFRVDGACILVMVLRLGIGEPQEGKHSQIKYFGCGRHFFYRENNVQGNDCNGCVDV